MGCGNSKSETVVVSPNKSTSQPSQPSNNTSTVKPSSTAPEKDGPRSNNVEEYYTLGDELGRGAFSIVRKAKLKKNGEAVAVKIIEKKFVEQQDLVLLAREIEILKKVSHPNVLKLVEVFETDDTISLVMELITGGELFYKIVEKGNYSEKDAADIVRQILRGVQYLHENGICHRDLKPENLLCTAANEPEYQPFRVIIADFGLSKIFNNGEALETSCGTPDYVAPEVITAEGSYDKSVDMWSCGVITYVLLCGFSPFLSSTQHGLFDKIVKCEYDFPDPEWTNISDHAKDFIRKLLVKDPSQRSTAAQCLDHPWLSGTNHPSEHLTKISEKMNTYNENRKNSFKR